MEFANEKELSIGSLVMNETGDIHEIGAGWMIDDGAGSYPVIINERVSNILLDLGFRYRNDGFELYVPRSHDVRIDNDWEVYLESIFIDIKYIHQLQSLIQLVAPPK